MTHTLSFRQVAALKRTAQNNYPLVARLEKLQAKIAEMQDEITVINAQIEGAEMGSKALTGGFTSFDLIERQVVGTGKFDENGKELKLTKYVPRTDKLHFNEESNNYELVIPEETGKLFEATDDAANEVGETVDEF